MFQTLGAFAEFERNIIAEHIKAGLRTAKLKGHKLGRKIGPEGSSRGTLWRRRQVLSRADH